MTTREDRQADPAVDRDRAIAALIYCAKQHPEHTLGEVIARAVFHARTDLYSGTDEALTAAFHSYAREQA